MRRGVVAVVLLLGCRKPSDARPAPVAIPSTAVVAPEAGVAPPETAAVDASTAKPLGAPSSRGVKPKIVLWYGEEEGAPPPDPAFPRVISGVRADGLPAITSDGRFVVTLAQDESGKTCAPWQLLVLELPKAKGRSKVARRAPLVSECGEDKDAKGDGYVPNAIGRMNEAQVKAANAIVDGYTLRSFDAGPSRTLETSAQELRFDAAILKVVPDADDRPRRAEASASSGPLFSVDLTPIAKIGPHPSAGSEQGVLVGGTFDVDVETRTLLVRGTYVTANSWFGAHLTTHALKF